MGDLLTDGGEDEPYPESPEIFDEEGDSMAFGQGIGDGLKAGLDPRKLDPRPGKYKAAEANKFYYYPAFLLAWLFKVGVAVLLGHTAGTALPL